ncbi:MAG TPA: flagellar protein FlaG [Syntrophobacteraceae bacterium]|jgi:flagellar protein FlaG|nr:flagellar protein FlaG [Syntrophobacteraceae bacterium]
MDTKIPNIKPMAMEPWVLPEHNIREPDLIKPVAKAEESSFQRLTRDSENRKQGKSASLDPEKAKELAEDIQNYLADFDVSLSFEISEQTGRLVAKVINNETREVIRQIPPEDLPKVREKLEELRGVLFAGKA